MAEKLSVIISQTPRDDAAGQSLQDALAARLADWPEVELSLLPHLYDLAPGGPAVQFLQAIRGEMVVFSWLYPRAAFWVLQANDVGGRMGGNLPADAEEVEPPPPARRCGNADDLVHRSPHGGPAEVYVAELARDSSAARSLLRANRAIWVACRRDAQHRVGMSLEARNMPTRGLAA